MARRACCTACGKTIIKGELYYGEEATFYEKKPLCEACFYEDEPVVTLYREQDKEPLYISQTRNGTYGKFRALWHSTDPWRGRYKLSSESYTMVFSDAILAYHESEAMLKELNDKAMEKLSSAKINYYRAFLRTSNLFCTDYDIWVKKDLAHMLGSHFIMQNIKTEVNYNDPLYSTGILFSRDDLKKLQSLLGNKYKLERDSDILSLVQEKGDALVEEIKKAYATKAKRVQNQGDNAADDKWEQTG